MTIPKTMRAIAIEQPGGPEHAKVEEAPGLFLAPETLEAARAAVPGVDVYALEARWRAFAAGKPLPRDADAAFLGWLRRLNLTPRE